MNRIDIKIFFKIAGTILFLSNCVSIPHIVLPLKDISSSELNDPAHDKKVLIASRSSNFKQAIIDKIKENYQDQPVYVKFIGLDDIKKEKAEQYQAIVMINTCMSWDMDRKVHGYLNRYQDHNHIIVLTTSGDGGWMPKMKGRNFDAVSAASKPANVDEVANKIIEKIDALIIGTIGDRI